MYSFVGRRSTIAETTAASAAAAHLGVTTYMFFSRIRTLYFSEDSVQHPPPWGSYSEPKGNSSIEVNRKKQVTRTYPL